jgi:acyl-CoA synthetase
MGSPRPAPLLTLLSAPAVAAYTAADFWGDETIYCLLARHARATPQAYAVRDHIVG